MATLGQMSRGCDLMAWRCPRLTTSSLLCGLVSSNKYPRPVKQQVCVYNGENVSVILPKYALVHVGCRITRLCCEISRSQIAAFIAVLRTTTCARPLSLTSRFTFSFNHQRAPCRQRTDRRRIECLTSLWSVAYQVRNNCCIHASKMCTLKVPVVCVFWPFYAEYTCIIVVMKRYCLGWAANVA